MTSVTLAEIFEILKKCHIDVDGVGRIEDFPTIYKQTGYERQGPVALCQDLDALEKVTILNYDWTRPDFQEYCKGRGVVCCDWSKSVEESPRVAHINAAKLQDAWELWLRQIKALDPETYKKPFTKHDRERVLLSTIYYLPNKIN